MRRVENPGVVSSDAPEIVGSALNQLPLRLQRRAMTTAYPAHVRKWLSARAKTAFAARGFSVSQRELPPEPDVGDVESAQPEASISANGRYEKFVDDIADFVIKTQERERPVFVGDLLYLQGYGTGGDQSLKEVTRVVTEYDPKRDSAQLATREIKLHGYGPELTEWFTGLKDPTGRIGYRLVLYRGENRATLKNMIAARRMALRRKEVDAEKREAEQKDIASRTPWLADVISAVGRPYDAVQAKIIMRYLKNHGVKASIRVRRYSMASGLDFNSARKDDRGQRLPWTQDEAAAISRLLIGQTRTRHDGTLAVDDDIHPMAHEDRSDSRSDYYDPGGVRVPIENVPLIQQIAAEEIKKAGEKLTPFGESLL